MKKTAAHRLVLARETLNPTKRVSLDARRKNAEACVRPNLARATMPFSGDVDRSIQGAPGLAVAPKRP
jgi:hypothetical protein